MLSGLGIDPVFASPDLLRMRDPGVITDDVVDTSPGEGPRVRGDCLARVLDVCSGARGVGPLVWRSSLNRYAVCSMRGPSY